MATAEHPQHCPLEARAWIDDELVAASTRTLRVNRAEGGPILCFPATDVRRELPAPPAEILLAAAPAGYVAFDHDNAKVRLMLVDRAPGAPERESTLKRFPVWGDAADLVGLLNVQPDGERTYVGVPRDDGGRHRGVVEGSQLLGQAIVAAGHHAPGRRVVHASMVFMRAANTSEPLHIQLDELSAGRNMTTLAPHVRQAGKLCASGIMLLDVTAPDVMRHAAAKPDTAGPYESVPHDMSVIGRDVRFVGGAYTGDPEAPPGPPLIDAWVRFRDLPEQPALHTALLAHFTGHVSIATAMRPHAGIGQNQAHRTLSTAVNAISIAFHSDVRADRWMLYRHNSTFSGDGMTHSECRVYNEEGALLASFTVEAMVRRFTGGRPADERRSL